MHNLCNLAFSTGFEPVSPTGKVNLSGTLELLAAILNYVLHKLVQHARSAL